MRFSLAAATCVVSMALLAGCSSSQGGALPGGSSSFTAPMGHGVFQGQPQRSTIVHGKISIEQMLKMQIAGKLAANMPLAALKADLKYVETHGRPNFKTMPMKKGGGAMAVAVDENYSDVIDFGKKFKKVVGYYNVEENGCYYPTTVKVDHKNNVWNSCEYDSSFINGAAQEYSSSGSLLATYDAGARCPSNLTGCEDFYGYSYDFGENGTDVVVAMPFTEAFEGCSGYYCNYAYGSGFDVFTSPSSAPTFINVYEGNNTPGVYIYDVGYMDIDANNIYFEYFGEPSTGYTEGYGIGEIANFATSPTFVSLVAPGQAGAPEFWGGTEVNAADNRLSTLDQETREDTVSALPFSALGTVYGPTLQDGLGYGDPVAGGWNAAETSFVAGDDYGWLDTISSSNSAKIVPSDDCPYGCDGASYIPSDHE
jgi:hypothetical protein